MTTKMEKQCLIRIVDDEEEVRQALSFLLQSEGYEVVSYSNAKDFLTHDQESIPGCLLSDIRMEEMSGLELMRELKKRNSVLPVILVTAFGDIEMAVDSMKDGATDFLVKPVNAEKLFSAVTHALRIDLERRHGLQRNWNWQAKWNELTKREKEILRWVAKGKTSKQISVILEISDRTVETHRAAANKKIGLISPAQIALFLAQIEDI